MLELFTCPKYPGELRLTSRACAQSWRKALHPVPGEPAAICHGCTIGAEYAGESVAACRTDDGLNQLCVRCTRYASRFVFGVVCVSCYNREREIAINRNARGKPPVRLAKPFPSALTLRTCHATRKFAAQVCSTEELLLRVLRSEEGTVEIGRASGSLQFIGR